MQNFVVSSAFGLEKIVKTELKRMGFQVDSVVDGAMRFSGELADVARLNYNLRCADRVYLSLAQFKATSFEALYQGILAIPWPDYIAVNDAFPVNAKSKKSKLFSLSDIQSISKKAIVNRLAKHYGVDWFKENGAPLAIHIHIINDMVEVLLDSSGDGLHKRGYRAKANAAPIKETLAAGLVLLSDWRGDTQLVDPMCGTGTLLIEAALIMRNIAPGLGRRFAAEQWSFIPECVFKNAKKEAYSAIDYDRQLTLQGYDIDPRAIVTAKENAELAGVDDIIDFQVQDITDWQPNHANLTVISNPPYGERLEDAPKAYTLYQQLAAKITPLGCSVFVITAHADLEKAFVRKADKNRKLFNGRIKCYYYQYYRKRQTAPISNG